MHRLPRAFRLRQQQIVSPRLNRISQRRIQSQTVYKPNGEPVRYQAVRFKKPGLTLRRTATIGLYTGCIYAYINIIGRYLDIELVDDEELEDEVDEEDDGEGPYYADEDSTFIPMTWATKMPRTFYRGSDPEWQEFVKVAKDKQRHRKIQDELVQIVFTGSQQHPGIHRQLGNEAKIGKYWLDISFPDGPPQEFERSGLEIGDGFIAWSQQRISPENQWRLMRALYPKAAFDSIWATTKVLAGIQYRRVKQALGWEGRDPFSPEERYRHAMDMMQKQQQVRERKEVGKAQMDPDGNPSAVVGSSSNNEAQPPRPSTGDGKRLPWTISVPLPSSNSSTSTDIPIAMHVFQSTLSKQWNPKKMEPPRGSFVVQGMVEVRGARGRMLFDVSACYDPKVGKYVAVNAGVRNFKRWNQAPRGGP
ncbi:hypothetical protein M409DRAFT_56759 [Zasmidium cellare ATCC 36951]|uniref:Uncharacterized protein n=1 Tax=Zasmidium cellare ATCC 36951 TaxID=1080233 RepID=A0A6A6CEZ8_ZASCE|nr:uncharacterized protein M409DRAFT_56759 [Zasmidium cellare ATCC 36951]KAF2164502.1 hypothetical protein M409DRAFT_56759 [Zasmidium cellare ATCC 36951]